jgi:putative endonuclease
VTTKALGNLGENLVIELLKAQGWQILATQWHCPWGELDIVASDRLTWLIFVEVKTRSFVNWDLNGAMAITKSKQKKLHLSALEFLGMHPQLSHLSCRFDVALVTSKLTIRGLKNLALHTYIESAFTVEEL